MTSEERDKLRVISERLQAIVSAEAFGTVDQCQELETIVEKLDRMTDGWDKIG
ncbi:MAG: hypothetical protein GY869_07985, partial [Planctomycetes bacterium]|nr:hypothetical protein [Planctomycetota bacterium]